MARIPASKYPKLWDRSGNVIAVLKDAYDVIVTDELITGDSGGQEVLDFKLPYGSANRPLVKNEMYVTVGGGTFEVRTPWDGWDAGNPTPISSIHCEASWYDLAEKDPLIIDTPITDAATALDTILAGTGWTVDQCDPTVGTIQVIEASSPLQLLRLLPQAFGGELVFDSQAKTVSLVTRRGSAAIVALYAHGRNLVGNARQEDTTNLVTRLYPYGSTSGTVNGQGTNGVPLDISSVNAGIPYLEDYSFYDDNDWPHTIRAAVIQADNIMDPDTLKTWGQQQLTILCKPAYTYTIQQSNTGDNDAEPELGDQVRVHDNDLDIDVQARVVKRVRNILQPALTVYTIDTALNTLSQVLVSSGQGGAVAPTDVPDTTIPADPTAVSIAQAGVTGPDGSMQASETVSWTQVTQNDDGTPITDLAGYYVRYAVGGGAWHYIQVLFPDTSAWIGYFPPDVSLTAEVRAYDTSNNASNWVAATGVITTDDDIPPNQPSAPVIDVASLPGIMRVYWDGLDLDGLPMPDDFAFVEVHASTDATAIADDTNLVDTLLAAGYSDLTNAYDQNLYVWFVALDRMHNASDPSTKSVGAVRRLVDTDAIDGFVTNRLLGPDVVQQANIADLAVGTAQMQDLAVVTAKIGNLAVNDAKIASVSVGKLTAGLLVADVTVSARIKTADSGARTEMNSTGFHVFNAGGTEVATLGIVSGTPSLQITGGTVVGGVYKSAASGARVEISSTLGYDVIGFYTAAGAANYIGNAGGNYLLQQTASGALFIVGTISGGPATGQQGIQQPNAQYASLGVVYVNSGATINTGCQINGGLNVNGGATLNGATTLDNPTLINYGTSAGGTANCIFNAAGQFIRVTSSRRYKQNIKPITLDEARVILDSTPVKFRGKADVKRDKSAPYAWGWIAEDLHDLDLNPLVVYEDGEIESVAYDRIPAAHTVILQDFNARIRALEQEIVRLKERAA